MEIAPIYVTNDVKMARSQLLTYESQNQANYQSLSAVLNNYPVPLDATFKSQVQNAANIAHDNIVKLQSSTDCWSVPNRCIKTRDSIKANMVEQPNKYLINKFQKGLSYTAKFGSYNFFVPMIPNQSTLNNLILSVGNVQTQDHYYPTSGFGVYGGSINGIAHDDGGRKDGDYAIYLENSQWLIKWTYYCGPQSPGCKDSTDYYKVVISNNDTAILYNSMLY